jgi:hypothetical protein
VRHIKVIYPVQILFIIFLLLLVSCAKKEAPDIPEEQILARVGDRIITSDEFKYSYEFSFAPLRRGANPRKVYLNHMVNELLLANEGYRRGLHQTLYVTKRLNRRRRNNLLEAFYLKHVHSKVKIPEDDLQDAIKKSTVNFRMVIWPTTTQNEAEKAYQEASKSSLEDYIEGRIANREVPLTDKKFYETDWIDYLEMPPEMFDYIKDLEIGETSQPFPYGDGYALAQVLDINLHGITTNELKYGAKRKNIRARLYNIESDRIVHEVMDSLLTPLDIRVKGSMVEQLTPLLYQWFLDGLPKQRSVFTLLQNPPDSAKQYIYGIRDLMDHTLLTYKKGHKTVEDYLKFMDYYRSTLDKSSSYEDFSNRLITEIGRMVKDEVFIKIAEEEGFADSAHIVQDLKLWQQKWTYDKYRHEVVKDQEVSTEEMQEFFKHRWRELDIADVDTTRFYKYENDVYNAVLHEKHLALLDQKLQDLRERYSVWINEEILNGMELTDSPKSLQTSYIFRKNFSGEALVPVADMKWIYF